jgi:hypothetical protein
MRFLLSHLKVFFTNRIGAVFVFTNLILAVWGLSEKGWDYESFHFYYEPLAIKIITILNLPAIFIAELIYEWLYSPPKFGSTMVRIYDFEMFLTVVFSIFQWLLFGYFLNWLFRINQEKIK